MVIDDHLCTLYNEVCLMIILFIKIDVEIILPICRNTSYSDHWYLTSNYCHTIGYTSANNIHIQEKTWWFQIVFNVRISI